MTIEELKFRSAGALGAGVLRTLGKTLRIEVEGDEGFRTLRREGRPLVFTFWHSWILPLAYLHRGEGIVVLSSQHRDGEYSNWMIRQLGFSTVRGSSTRGGARALKGIVRRLKAGQDVAFTPDGPRGPARRFKLGALVAAQLTGAPMIPVSMEATGIWRLNSWDRFVVPRPFGRFRVRYGPPHHIPRDAGPDELAEYARQLTAHMDETEDGVS